LSIATPISPSNDFRWNSGRAQPPRWLPALASAILALSLYAVTLGGVYIYDDVQIVSLDSRVSNPHLWYQFWTRDYFNGGMDNLYRPLVSQTYGLQWWMSNGNPWTFHALNILLHALTAALTAELARKLAGWRPGLIAGLIFAAHPVHAEAVAGIVGRAELMCAIGMLGAMILFLRNPMTLRRALGIYALCMLSMLSKEQGMLMPFLLLTLEPVRRCKMQSTPEIASDDTKQKQAMRWLIVLLTWSVSALIVLRESALKLRFEWDRSFLDFTIQPMVHSYGIDRVLVPLALLGKYTGLMIAPLRLSIDYGVAVLGSHVWLGNPFLWLGIAVAMGWIVGTTICLRRRWWSGLFLLLAMAMTYSMVSNFLIIGTIFGERLIYLPSAFAIILVAIGLARLQGKIWIGLFVAVVILYSMRTFTYIRHWNNQDSFYAYSLANQPRSVRLHLLVAYNDYVEGRLEEAQKIMADSRQIAPDYVQNWRYSGTIAEKQGDWTAAYDFFNHARQLQPSFDLDNHCLHAVEMMEKQKHQVSTRHGE
jgi:hypothetical protein